MGCNNGLLKKQFENKVNHELTLCEKHNASEEVKRVVYESERAIYLNNRKETRRCVPLNTDLIHMDRGISSQEWDAFERKLDAENESEEERWLAKIETEDLRDAVRNLRKNQKEVIRLLLDKKSQEEIAGILGITEGAVSQRIETIAKKLERVLPPLVLHALTAGRKTVKEGR